MAGHSKWANTKHRKARQDKKRSALFGKLSRAIFVAAKNGDPNPDNNATLATAIEKAKSYSLPKDNIEAAIAKASGAANDGATWNEVIYEGYGPAGIAVYVECLTDNRNRTAADVRAAFTKVGGNLGTSGSVAFQFQRKGEIVIDLDSDQFSEDDFMLAVADAGGDDYTLEDEGNLAVVVTDSSELMAVKRSLEDAAYAVRGAELMMVPATPQAVSASEAKQVMRLIDRLEDLDDVQNVFHSMDFDEDQLED
ncbi:MAG: YebC/PmpR family DNA-binding transcriptional regulator [Coriobacteriia bacterium]|nr:YebC/PmpR family DNA-binding transcriptional regulator [Coriobacteriia bacterium]